MAKSSFFDWQDKSSGDWSSPFDIGKSFTGGYGDFSEKASSGASKSKNFLDAFAAGIKSSDENKYRSLGESNRPIFGEGFSGRGGQVLENLGVVYPQQQGPMFLPGTEGKRSIWGEVGRIAGSLGGALIGGPAGASIGGQLGGTVGGFF